MNANIPRDPGEAIDELWRLRRSADGKRWQIAAAFLGHRNPTVRSEAVSLLGHWTAFEAVPLLVKMLENDPDVGVRERCALALGFVGEATRSLPEMAALRRIVLDKREPQSLREASYQALLFMHGRDEEAPLASLPQNLSWVESLAT